MSPDTTRPAIGSRMGYPPMPPTNPTNTAREVLTSALVGRKEEREGMCVSLVLVLVLVHLQLCYCRVPVLPSIGNDCITVCFYASLSVDKITHHHHHHQSQSRSGLVIIQMVILIGHFQILHHHQAIIIIIIITITITIIIIIISSLTMCSGIEAPSPRWTVR